MRKKVVSALAATCMALAVTAAPVLAETVTIGVYEPASGDNGAGGKQETLGMLYAQSIQPTVEIGGTTYDVLQRQGPVRCFQAGWRRCFRGAWFLWFRRFHRGFRHL